MNAFRLIIVSLILLGLALAVWRLQRFRLAKLITRWILLPLLLLFFILAFVSNHIIEKAAENKVYSEVNLIPQRETALVLGVYKNSAPEFFSKRVDAAVILYKAGKVKNFIVSGADGPDNYDEAADMKAALVSRGVPFDNHYG